VSSRRRAECRSCGRNLTLNQDDHIHPHKRLTTPCPGSGRPPAGEPPCDHDCGRKAGRVSWPEPYEPGKPHASTYVCYDPEHQAEARLWVKSVTGHEGVFIGRSAAAPAVQVSMQVASDAS